jgi:hypothetical protein
MQPIPFATTPWDQIVTNLFQGGHDYRPELLGPVEPAVVGDEFDTVISLYSRHDGYGPADGVEHIVHTIRDGEISPQDLARVRELGDHAAMRVVEGFKVLVRCQAGYNRSGFVAGFALTTLGYTADEAIDRIRARRSPYALCNEHFVRYLQAATNHADRDGKRCTCTHRAYGTHTDEGCQMLGCPCQGTGE